MDAVQNIKKNVRKHVRENNLSVSSLESKAGIKRSSLQSILDDRTKNPGLDIITKLSETLRCSIDDLISNDINYNNLDTSNPEKFVSKELVSEAIKYVLGFLSQLEKEEIHIDKLLYAIKEICDYSIEQKINSIDVQFSLWVCKKFIK